MDVVSKKTLKLFSGQGHPELGSEIAAALGIPLGDVKLSTFASGESYVRYGENIRGADAFLLQTHCDPINDRIMEQLLMIDAAKRASAKRITAVVPYYGYARQDRKAEGREAISARLLADMLTAAGADRVVTVDLHTGQIQGFFDFPVDHLEAVPLLADYIGGLVGGEGITVVAPDAGGGKLARRFMECLGDDNDIELAFVDKHRPKGTHNVAVANTVVGQVEGRTCLLVDDMIDTGGTLASAADLLVARGAGVGDHRRHPRAPVGARRGSAQERPGARGRGHQHRADPEREALRQPHGAVDRAPRRPGDPRRVRRHQRQPAVPRPHALTSDQPPPQTCVNKPGHRGVCSRRYAVWALRLGDLGRQRPQWLASFVSERPSRHARHHPHLRAARRPRLAPGWTNPSLRPGARGRLRAGQRPRHHHGAGA